MILSAERPISHETPPDCLGKVLFGFWDWRRPFEVKRRLIWRGLLIMYEGR